MDLPEGLRWRRDLIAAGVAPDEVRRQLDRGDLVAVRRGAYLPSGALPDDPVARHVLQVRAAVRDLAGAPVVSHVSAAALHGLAIWNVPLARVQLTRNRRSGARSTRSLHVHAASIDPDEVVRVDGLAVTSVSRTIADLARTLDFERAVVLADSALRTTPVTAEDLWGALGRAPYRPGNPNARQVLRFADARSASPGESRSRVAIARAGLPRPELQCEVRSASGAFIARTDFAWPELGTVGEFDGAVKYGRLLKPGQQPGDVVFGEKVREDAIRAETLHVARWIWPELDYFAPVARRISRGFPS